MSQFYKFFDQKGYKPMGTLFSVDALLLGAMHQEKLAVAEMVEQVDIREPDYPNTFYEVVVKTRYKYVRPDIAKAHTRIWLPRDLTSHDLLEIERIKKELGL